MKAKLLVALVAASFLAPIAASAAEKPRRIEISVTANGFEPARVNVMKGEPLELVVTRKTDDTCAKEIVIPDENIKADLPLGKPVTLAFTPNRSGEIRYACGMNMVTGVLVVASNEPPGDAGTSRMQGARGEQGTEGMPGMAGDRHGGAMGMHCGRMHRGAGSHDS